MRLAESQSIPKITCNFWEVDISDSPCTCVLPLPLDI